MCVTEVWTYSECGCSIEHKVPCPRSIDVATSARTFSPQEDAVSSPLFRFHNPTISEIPQSPSLFHSPRSSPLWQTSSVSDLDTTSNPDSTNSCGDIEIICKAFLEPICDSCVLKEHKAVMALYAEDLLSGAGLVWGSEVNIEINPQDNSKRTSVLDPFARQGTDAVSLSFSESSAPVGAYTSPVYDHHEADTPVSTAEDADDESSLYYVESPPPADNLRPPTDVRGRPRSRTKQLRRRGIDLSRDELRISSRWSSGEKRSMESFRDAIREKAKHLGNDPLFFGKWSAKTGRPFFKDAKAVKDKFTGSLRSSVSRSRDRRMERDIIERATTTHDNKSQDQSSNLNNVIQGAAGVPPEQQMSLRRVQSSISTRGQSSSPSLTSSSYETPVFAARCPPQVANVSPQHREREISWKSHLQHDLEPAMNRKSRHKKAIYLVQEELEENKEFEAHNGDRKILPSNYFLDYNHELRRGPSAQPLVLPSSSMSAISKHDVERYWRLPSLVPTIDRPAHSPNTTSSFPPQPQHMDEIIGSADLESAWWAPGSRNASTSSKSGPSDISDRSPTTNLVAALKARMADSSNEHDKASARPLLQSSTGLAYDMPLTPPATADSDRYYARHSPSRIASKRLVSSMSLPGGLDVASRSSSYHYDQASHNEDEEAAAEMQKLALHPLMTRLSHENPVRPSMTLGPVCKHDF